MATGSRPSTPTRACPRVLTLGLLLIANAFHVADEGFEKAIWGPTELPAGNVNCPTATEPCSAFPVYRELGVDIFQFQLHWNEVAPTRPRHPRHPGDPAYHWGPVDEVVEAARADRVALAAQVMRTPPWANGGRSWQWAPNHPGAYADFVHAAARRYPTIRRWMIWGEPARAENFRPMRRGTATTRTTTPSLDRSYAALETVIGANVVRADMTLIGGTVPPHDFIDCLRPANGGPPRVVALPPTLSMRGFRRAPTVHPATSAASMTSAPCTRESRPPYLVRIARSRSSGYRELMIVCDYRGLFQRDLLASR